MKAAYSANEAVATCRQRQITKLSFRVNTSKARTSQYKSLERATLQSTADES